jgi:spoIIIJ-associated protein
MEWVEITARTVEEARDVALDRLGVDEQDADIEVLEEPKPGLFGRLRGQARVRARVRPATPRPKVERRDRKRRSGSEGGGKSESGQDAPKQTAREGDRRGRGSRGGGSANGSGRSGQDRADRERERPAMPELSIQQQTEIVEGFLTGLADAFGVDDATVSHAEIDEGLVEVRLDGQELGTLVGPKGATLQSVQELARTVVQRQGGGTQEGRLRVDIAGYRQRRKDALERFTRSVAEDVVSSGARKALEPMHAADRKVVHDTVNDIEGVHSLSEGEEPRRRVVLVPDE